VVRGPTNGINLLSQLQVPLTLTKVLRSGGSGVVMSGLRAVLLSSMRHLWWGILRLAVTLLRHGKQLLIDSFTSLGLAKWTMDLPVYSTAEPDLHCRNSTISLHVLWNMQHGMHAT